MLEREALLPNLVTGLVSVPVLGVLPRSLAGFTVPLATAAVFLALAGVDSMPIAFVKRRSNVVQS